MAYQDHRDVQLRILVEIVNGVSVLRLYQGTELVDSITSNHFKFSISGDAPPVPCGPRDYLKTL
jgi:hypothetical protein